MSALITKLHETVKALRIAERNQSLGGNHEYHKLEEAQRDYNLAVKDIKSALNPQPVAFTQEELEVAFKRVQNPVHWKDAISAQVEANQLAVTIAAVWHFTSTYCTVKPIKDGTEFLITSIGYRAGPAGDH
ncbi:unnamed protein product [Sphagnum tenellum]